MSDRDARMLVVGGGIGWLSAVLCLSLLPVEGARWNIVGMVIVAYPIAFALLAWAAEAWMERSKRPASRAPTDA